MPTEVRSLSRSPAAQEADIPESALGGRLPRSMDLSPRSLALVAAIQGPLNNQIAGVSGQLQGIAGRLTGLESEVRG